MLNPRTEKPRGVLNLKTGQQKFQLSRYFPTQDLAFFVEHYWIVSWNLRGQEPYLQEVLPHPSVHVVFEKDGARVIGVIEGRFSRVLEGEGRVFGIKFKPGAFYPFLKSPVSSFTNSSLSLRQAFGVETVRLEATLLSLEHESQMVELAEDFIRSHLPAQDVNVEIINRVIDLIVADPAITRVDHLLKRVALNKRTLQRLFSQYVGVSPKWVIKRYRLHEAAERLAEGLVLDWPRLALALGYFDQAHFIKDFKTLVGKTPAEYARHH